MKRGPWFSIHHINVRLVAALCFGCALGATGWVAYRLTQLNPPLLDNIAARRGAVPTTTRWRENETQEPAWQDQNPFHSPYLDNLAAQRKKKADAQAAPKSTPQAARKTVSPKSEPHPPPRTLTLIYRGALTRVDGTTVAMFERNRQKGTLLLETGDRFDNLRLLDIDRHNATVSLDNNGTQHRLPVGKCVTLTPPHPKKKPTL